MISEHICTLIALPTCIKCQQRQFCIAVISL